MKRRWLLFGIVAVIGLVGLTGCDVFQIHESSYGEESGIVNDADAPGNTGGAGGTGVGQKSTSGPKEELTGTSTQRLGTGDTGAIATPGPGRAGR